MAEAADSNRRWWILVAMTGSLSMILVDETVVSVALPTIQRDLDVSGCRAGAAAHSGARTRASQCVEWRITRLQAELDAIR